MRQAAEPGWLARAARKPAPADQLEKGFRWLKFEPGLESAFVAERFAEGRRFVRVNLIVLVALIGTINALDRIVMPEIAASFPFRARLAFMLPALALAFVLTMVPRAERWYPRVMTVVAVLMLCAVGSVGLWAWQQGEDRLIVREIFAIIAIYFMLGLSFRSALAANAAGVVFYAAMAARWAGMPGPEMLHAVTTLVLANVLCVAGAYKLEHARRTVWLEARMLEDHALQDGLTGISNRRRFDEHLERTWRQGQRDNKALSLLFADIDHFKKYNDRYGHQAGDAALKVLARVLAGSMRRPLDIAARFGGEEFAVLLYDAGRDFAVRTADAIVEGLREAAIPHEDSATGLLTVSIGVATAVPVEGRSAAGLLQLADQALYGAKDAGRNQVLSLESEYQQMQTGYFHRKLLRGSAPPSAQ